MRKMDPPGGRLASLLNSLFNQSASKKKKSKLITQSMKDEDESPGGRRSSINHFRRSSTAYSKSLYSSFSSGFRTPPYVETPTKSCKDFRTFSNQKQAVSLSKYNGHVKSTTLANEFLDDKIRRSLAWLDENPKYSNGLFEKDSIWADKYPSEKQKLKKSNTQHFPISAYARRATTIQG